MSTNNLYRFLSSGTSDIQSFIQSLAPAVTGRSISKDQVNSFKLACEKSILDAKNNPESKLYREEKSAKVLGTVFFLAQGFLQKSTKSSPCRKQQQAHRFFDILLKLPLELQMLICNQLTELTKPFIDKKLLENSLSYRRLKL